MGTVFGLVFVAVIHRTLRKNLRAKVRNSRSLTEAKISFSLTKHSSRDYTKLPVTKEKQRQKLTQSKNDDHDFAIGIETSHYSLGIADSPLFGRGGDCHCSHYHGACAYILWCFLQRSMFASQLGMVGDRHGKATLGEIDAGAAVTNLKTRHCHG